MLSYILILLHSNLLCRLDQYAAQETCARTLKYAKIHLMTPNSYADVRMDSTEVNVKIIQVKCRKFHFYIPYRQNFVGTKRQNFAQMTKTFPSDSLIKYSKKIFRIDAFFYLIFRQAKFGIYIYRIK